MIHNLIVSGNVQELERQWQHLLIFISLRTGEKVETIKSKFENFYDLLLNLVTMCNLEDSMSRLKLE